MEWRSCRRCDDVKEKIKRKLGQRLSSWLRRGSSLQRAMAILSAEARVEKKSSVGSGEYTVQSRLAVFYTPSPRRADAHKGEDTPQSRGVRRSSWTFRPTRLVALVRTTGGVRDKAWGGRTKVLPVCARSTRRQKWVVHGMDHRRSGLDRSNGRNA